MKRGFTLLELLISCTLLLVVLGILSTVITRANALRSEGVRRTTLMTQGRAALDTIAEDLQNIIGTNLAVLAGTEWMVESYGSTNAGLRLVRTRGAPRNPASGEVAALPVETIYYQVSETNATYFLYRGRTPYVAGDEPSTTNLGFTVTRQEDPSGGSDPVTNIVAGSGITLIPSGQTGETIMMPVNSASSTRIYDWTTSTAAWIDVVPTANSNVNRVVATVIFSNAFTSVSIYTNTPAATTNPSGFWPDTSRTTVATGYQALAFILTNNAVVTDGSDTNGFVSITNLLAGAAGLFTNTPPVNATNLIDTATQATFTNAWHVFHWEGDQPQYTNTFVEVHYAWTNLPVNIVSNAWTLPPDTNAVDGVQGSTATYDWARWDTAVNPSLPPLPWRVNTITNVNVFTNHAAATPWIAFGSPGLQPTNAFAFLPLSLHTTNVFTFAVNGDAFETLSTNFSVAVAHGDTLAPIQTQVFWRASETVSTNQITPENLIVTVRQRVWLVTTNILETFVPASLIPTNHYIYPAQQSIRVWVATARYNDTIWVPHTLIEDYGGGTADIISLWLEHGDRDRFDFLYGTDLITGFVGSPPIEGAASVDEVIDGVAKLYFQPLRFFRASAEEPWRLDFWSPGNTEPPVCIDIYLELLDPRVARRASTMPDNSEQQKAFVERNVVRLSRRVPLHPYNRWREP